MARSLHLSFICIPQSTRTLDQRGVEPRQAVSPKALRPWTIPLRYSVGCSNCSGTLNWRAALPVHASIISATIHVDHARPCPVLLIEKQNSQWLDATSIIGSCRNVFQLEVLRLSLLLGRLLANMEAAQLLLRQQVDADLAVAHCLKLAPCHAEVPQSRFRKTHLKNCACGGSFPQCEFRTVRLKLAPCHA